MPVVIMPEWNTLSIVAYTVFAMLCLSFGVLESKGLLTLNYSKFRTSHGMSSRLGMFLLYFVPILAADIATFWFVASFDLVKLIIIAAINIHFIKRCLEVLFLHKYSGPINIATVIQIAAAYSLAAFLLAYLNQWSIDRIDGLFLLGMVLFAVGQVSNLYHHKLLADLRTDDNSYKIPTGGLFEFVTAPHYLMELSAWLGVALMSRHLAAYMIFVWTCSYLLARALRTHAWYHEKFADYPDDRRVIVPFIL
ncbi:methyltransferase [Pseudobacteriovorax antillogorgiicola]|uniref:Very-long-chain enoyl-CoA reductase n=1 Tax=Pseudobacteriovorax antillogorgiicola TaxID=1513793 RepID=A0A1Y6C919_9BACT|nr:methyltransferase [Pseudobacteriovorax antillogorgiicola]TCS49841.1 very-long-chain enoyl-CoA reductase [Pseudobacteriovorax antillogorgiicola]SMF43542.1 very-long-chain enoyl-CoA reductase [Pseudobacteriovorax antillogorgiicola]